MDGPLQAHRSGTTTLAGDRTLGWSIFGDPKGETVFWFHGTPGARSQLPFDAGDSAAEHGFRIVTVERPGTGHSTHHAYERIVDFAADLDHVATDVDAGDFAAVGLSGGGPYLLAAAHELPDRMKAGIVLGGIGPTRGSDAILSHTLLLVPAAAALERVRSPLSSGLSSLVRQVTPYADTAVSLFFTAMPGDREAFRSRPLDLRQFTADMIDANARSGMGSAVNDLILFGRHWGFELRNLEVPIVFYGGSSDVIVPYLHAERQAKRVPNSRLRTYEGRGHFAGYTSPTDIWTDIRKLWPAQPAALKKAARKSSAKARLPR